MPALLPDHPAHPAHPATLIALARSVPIRFEPLIPTAIAAGVRWQQGARRPLTHEQRQRLRHPNRAAPAPTNHPSSYCLTYPPHDSFAYTGNISAAACGVECTKRNCSCYDWIGTHTHAAQCRVVAATTHWMLAHSPDREQAFTHGSPWGPPPSPPPGPAPPPGPVDPGCGVNETMRVAYSKSLDGPWELEYFKGNDSPYYKGGGIVMPWPRSINCNVRRSDSAALHQSHCHHQRCILLCPAALALPLYYALLLFRLRLLLF